MPRIKPLAAALLLSSCISPVDTQDSKIDAPNFWSRLTAPQQADAEKAPAAEDTPLAIAADATVEQDWWKHFNDPVLDGLITEALANNKTLAIARQRVAEARAARAAQRSVLLPDVHGTASTQRGNAGSLGFFGGKPLTLNQAGFEASWELDLFGKNQARTAAATALLQSQEARTGGVRIALLAEVARTYYDYRNADWQITITEKNLVSQKRTFELTQAQMQGALASGFDVERAGAQVAATASALPQLRVARAAALNRLNVLMGTPPGTKDAMLNGIKPIQPLDAKILVAAPASVLAARPDVHAAERQYAATISNSDAALRSFFPTISLLGFYGVQDAPFGAANPWSLGASLVQPILNFGYLQAGLDAADAQEQQAFLTYQQTVLEALEDMENALSSYLNETARNKTLFEAAARNNKAVGMARDQYKNGYNALIDVLVIERDALAAESALADSDAKLRQDLIAIYTAAGGGWQEVVHSPAKAAVKP